MKKVILFVAVISAFSFASCKKDRTCTCTATYSDGTPSDTYVVTFTKAKKKDVKKDCIDQTSTDASGVKTTLSCKLK